ncbi:MAG: methyltransferase domain-containing protein [Candidatus Electrothrix sp. ATG2]|nr:methyltransferase domain-containing protein [Candidatus Electrothrix sp. ATG2]
MNFKTLIKFLSSTHVMLMLRIGKITKETCRTGFVLTAITEGIYDIMQSGPATFEDIQNVLKSDFNPEGLRAWLDLGVSLGELKKSTNGYSIKGKLSKELIKPANDTWRAFLQVRAEVFYDFIINTPSMLRKNMQFEYSEAHGELVARSSRTLEPFLLEVVDKIIPKNKSYRLLEVGCGSGIYIKRACELNPLLTAVGLEVQQSVVDFARKNIKTWNFENRVSIENADIREYECKPDFDMVTFYNLIYYFPFDERIDLLRNLGKHLKPGGELILTSMCKGKDPSLNLMNLWTSMTDGYGPLPNPKQIHEQLKKAGYHKVKSEMLIPSFISFRVTK